MDLGGIVEKGLEKINVETLTKAGRSALDVLQKASDRIESVSEKVSGVVDTAVDPLRKMEAIQDTVEAAADTVTGAAGTIKSIAGKAAGAVKSVFSGNARETAQEADVQRLEPAQSEPEQPAEEEAPANVPAPQKKTAVFSVIAIAALVIMGLVAAYTIAISLLKYNLARGLADSEFVGLQNFERFFSSPYEIATLKNSLLLRLIQMAAGLLAALPLIGWVRLGKNPGKTLTKACLCLIPFSVPYMISTLAVVKLIPRDILMDPDGVYLTFALGTVLQTAGFVGFCGGFFSYLKMRGIGNGARQGVLVAMLVLALSMATPDLSATMMLSNSLNTQSSLTFDFYAYRTGIQQMNFSLSSAVTVVKVALQCVLAIVPAILLCKIAKKDETRLEIPDVKKSFFTFSGAKLAWLVILLAMAVAAFGIETIARFTAEPEAAVDAVTTAAQEVAASQSILNSALVSAVVSVLGGALAGLVAFSFIVHFRSGRKGFGLAMIIAASACSLFMSEYLAVRNVGMINTPWPMILRAVIDPRLLCIAFALAVVLRMAPERRTRGVVLGLMLLGAAFAWGDFFSANLYAYAGNMIPLSCRLYQMIMNGGASVASMAGPDGITEAQYLAQQAMMPMVSLLVSLPALLLGIGGAAACIRGFKDAK